MKHLDNKYWRWYCQIVERAQGRALVGYAEVHHIVPRALGGGNNKDNLVSLTYREHVLAHWLLTKFTIGRDRSSMHYAVAAMTFTKGKRIVPTWLYDLAKRAQQTSEVRQRHLEAMQKPETSRRKSETMKKHFENPEARKRLAETGKLSRTPEARLKNSEAGKKRYKDPETLQRHSDTIKKRYEDPEVKRRHAESMKCHGTPEARQHNSEAQKKAKGTQESRQRHSEAMKRYHARRRSLTERQKSFG